MPEPFQFELVSPEKKVFGPAPVTMVTIPGGEGDYGVLVGHAPLITTVRPGVIEVYGQNDTTVTERIFVAGGFAEVTGERCTVLAEEALPVAQIDRAQTQQEISSLTEGVAHAANDTERADAEAKLAVARAKLDAIAA